MHLCILQQRHRLVDEQRRSSDFLVVCWKNGLPRIEEKHSYAAQMAAEDCGKVAYDLGLRKVKVFVKGPGQGRESAIRAINTCGIEVTEITDITPLPHNGCRPPKRRRV